MRKLWKSVGKTYLHKAATDDEISFVKERVRIPSGREFDYFHVECPYEVVFVVVEKKDTVCLIKQFRYLIQSEIMEIPAGSPHQGQSLEEGARQEALEEAGVRLSEILYLGEYYSSVGITNQKFHLYLGKCSSEHEQNLEDSEQIEVDWVKKSDIVSMLGKNEVKNSGAALGLCLAALRFGWH